VKGAYPSKSHRICSPPHESRGIASHGRQGFYFQRPRRRDRRFVRSWCFRRNNDLPHRSPTMPWWRLPGVPASAGSRVARWRLEVCHASPPTESALQSRLQLATICDQFDLCGPALLAEFLPLRLVGLHCFVTSRLRSIDPGPRSTASPGEREKAGARAGKATHTLGVGNNLARPITVRPNDKCVRAR
jgi:hypothetical protein